MDAIYLPVRPNGPKEGVLVAWGFTTEGERVLLDVCLGQRVNDRPERPPAGADRPLTGAGPQGIVGP